MAAKLDKVKNALLTVTENVGHYEALDKTDKYIVWAEDGEGTSSWSDNIKKAYSLTGTADYYTTQEYDPNVEKLGKAFGEARLSWKFNSIQYEEETGFIHFEWVWGVI